VSHTKLFCEAHETACSSGRRCVVVPQGLNAGKHQEGRSIRWGGYPHKR
jgi:hypothetical protein